MKSVIYYLLGAESPSAISFAQAYPEIYFFFVSEERIISGQDLENVECLEVTELAYEYIFGEPCSGFIPLTSFWYKRYCDYLDIPSPYLDLSATLVKIEQIFPGGVLPIRYVPDFSHASKWILKGNMDHKSNALEFWEESSYVPTLDENIKCQEWKGACENYLITGRTDDYGHYKMGLFRIHSEAFGKQGQILAAETIDDQELSSIVISLLERLGYSGYFTFNIIKSSETYLITSFRPYARSLIYSLRRAGVSLLDETKTNELAKSGIKMIVHICYSEYI
ncbi:hypothetical protein [Roseivirga sp. E12]|uniref:hypothetical protein n=1 Tax=Roseivirga sp. E12 TaxID=2819237 RepID=UPI001ABBF259|nr:hypothetical protein [Roseivirga sp. E12]MBO3697273.1 hypothetical protein [Roseivirga sp. E12]